MEHLHIILQMFYSIFHQGDYPGFLPFPMKRHSRRPVNFNVTDFHIQDFLDTRPGIIQKDHQELVPHANLRPGVRLCKKRFYCFFRHIVHFREPVILLDPDSCQSACNADIFRAAGCGIGNKCPDGRQLVVARSRSGVLLC